MRILVHGKNGTFDPKPKSDHSLILLVLCCLLTFLHPEEVFVVPACLGHAHQLEHSAVTEGKEKRILEYFSFFVAEFLREFGVRRRENSF